MSSISLPICVTAVPYAALKYAFPLSVIMADERYHTWLINNYVYVAGGWKKDKNDIVNYHDYCDGYSFATDRVKRNPSVLIQTSYDHAAVTSNKDDLCEVLKGFIREENYLVVFVDEFYLESCSCGGRKHFLHEQLIYGYDDERQVFKCVGLDTKRNFRKIDHGYQEFCRAYEYGLVCQIHGNLEWARKNRVIKLRKGQIPHLHELALERKLQNYINGEYDKENSSLIIEDEDKVYVGIRYYDFLIEAWKVERRDFDVYKHLNHFCEHKKILLEGLKYIDATLANEYDEKIVGVLENLRMFLLIAMRRGNSIRDDALVDKLRKLKEDDCRFLSSFCKLPRQKG